MRKLLCFLFGFMGIMPVLGAQNSDSSYLATRAQYVNDKTYLLGLSVFNRNPDNQFTMAGRHRLTYLPNDVNAVGFRVQHKWLGVAISYSPERLQAPSRGKTSEIDLHIFLYGRKHYIDAYYLNYTGFYIENYKSNDTLNKYFSSYPLLPKLDLTGAGLNYFYLFNHKKYSMRSSFIHNEIQLKSAGSFLLGLSGNYLNFYNPTSILPNQLDVNSSPAERLTNGTFYSASILPGYAHTFVYKKVYFTLAPTLGAVVQYQDFNAEGVDGVKRYTTSFRSIGRLALGYNSKLFYIGITGVTDSYNYNLARNVSLRMQISEARFIVGYRFVPRGFIKKLSHKMDKVPISL